jgi:hypothetical protein
VTDELAHRTLATNAFNASWSLLERERTRDEDLELLEVALASRHHWRREGGAQQVAIADWMVSRCFAELDEPRLALRFAMAALEAQPEDAPAWLRASLLEGLARAHASAGDALARADAIARAEAALEGEADPDDRAVIAEQLSTVPAARS